MLGSWRCMGQQRPELVFTAACCLLALLVTLSYLAVYQSAHRAAPLGGFARASEILLLLGLPSSSPGAPILKHTASAWESAGSEVSAHAGRTAVGRREGGI